VAVYRRTLWRNRVSLLSEQGSIRGFEDMIFVFEVEERTSSASALSLSCSASLAAFSAAFLSFSAAFARFFNSFLLGSPDWGLSSLKSVRQIHIYNSFRMTSYLGSVEEDMVRVGKLAFHHIRTNQILSRHGRLSDRVPQPGERRVRLLLPFPPVLRCPLSKKKQFYTH
jgi:hypothetical protein